MTTNRGGALTRAVLLGIGILVAGAGCGGKHVASTSGDQSTTLKGTRETSARPVESVKQEPMASVEPPPAGAGSASSDMSLSSPAASMSPSAAEEKAAVSEPAAPPQSSLLPSGPSATGSGEMPIPTAPLAALDDIYFDFDHYVVRDDARSILESNADWMRRQPDRSLLVEGHCDERGTIAYNLVLGEKRARSAKRYLEDLGIPGSRIQTISYGEVRPFCREHNENCWSKNRRAHFVAR